MVFPPATPPNSENLTTIVEFANRARKEGLLSLESEVTDLEDPFMKRSLQLAIDGNDPEDVADVMRTDIKAMKGRHKVPADWCQAYGIFAPTFGIIGAVLGPDRHAEPPRRPGQARIGYLRCIRRDLLGRVRRQRADAAAVEPDMKAMSAAEVVSREMVMEGVLAIQSGQSPRVIEETLLTYLPPSEAESVRAEQAA